MISISVDPAHPVVGRDASVGVDGCACDPFLLAVVYMGTEPPTTVFDKTCTNPPEAVGDFTPADVGPYQVQITCNGKTLATRDFSVG